MKNLLMILLTLSFVSCTSSSVKKEVRSEMKEVGTSQNMAEAMEKSKNKIRNSKSLTEQQKTDLLNLHQETYVKVRKHMTDMMKLKKVLFKNFAKKEYNDKKINYIAKKIAKINKQKMDLMFASLKKAKKILKGVDDEGVNQAVFWMEHNIDFR